MVDVHKHCPVCGTPIPLDETTCSTKCQNILNENQAKLRKSRITLFILMIIFILVFVFLMFFNK